MADTQAPQAPNSQAYGMRGDQIAAQQAMPLPQTAPQQGAPTTPAQDAQAVDPMALARDFDPGITPLAAPSTRPDEPVTAGLSLARAGWEKISGPAQSTGDDRYLQMAARIRQGGGAR